jgi:hypothetical protein
MPFLTSKFWNCECKENYIHHVSDVQCFLCHSISKDSHDSRLNELNASHVEKIDYYELEQLSEIKVLSEPIQFAIVKRGYCFPNRNVLENTASIPVIDAIISIDDEITNIALSASGKLNGKQLSIVEPRLLNT